MLNPVKTINNNPVIIVGNGIYEFASYCEAKLFYIKNKELIYYESATRFILSKFYRENIFDSLLEIGKVLEDKDCWIGYRFIEPLSQSRLLVKFYQFAPAYDAKLTLGNISLYGATLLEEEEIELLMNY